MLERPEPCTPASIRLFLASKPPHEEYDWGDASKCACAQYLESVGMLRREPIEARPRWRCPPAYQQYIDRLNYIAARVDTFGELLKVVEQDCLLGYGAEVRPKPLEWRMNYVNVVEFTQ